MSYLLDTHILLWWLADDKKLTESVREIIATKPVWVSVAVIWEMVIKKELGKLHIPGDLEKVIDSQEFIVLNIKKSHVLGLPDLEDIHADPFDRIQICQAKKEGLTFITKDRKIQQYAGLDFISV